MLRNLQKAKGLHSFLFTIQLVVSYWNFSPNQTMPIKLRHPSQSRFFHTVISASDPKCGICYLDVKHCTFKRRIEHFQKCWDENHAQIPQDTLLSPKRLEKAVVGVKTRDYELVPPNVAAKLSNAAVQKEGKDGGEDDEEDEEDEKKEEGHSRLQCPVCSEHLTKTSGIDTFTHLQHCIPTHQPIDCPLCTQSFELFPYNDRAVLGHLYIDHIIGISEDATDTQKEDIFDGALHAWSGRQELLQPAIYGGGRGIRKSWSAYEHRDSYAKKKERGHIGSKLCVVESVQYEDTNTIKEASTSHENNTLASTDKPLCRERKQSCLEQDISLSCYVAALPSLNENGFLDEGISMPVAQGDSCSDRAEDDEHFRVFGVTSSPPGIEVATTSMEELDAILSLQEDTLVLG